MACASTAQGFVAVGVTLVPPLEQVPLADFWDFAEDRLKIRVECVEGVGVVDAALVALGYACLTEGLQ